MGSGQVAIGTLLISRLRRSRRDFKAFFTDLLDVHSLTRHQAGVGGRCQVNEGAVGERRVDELPEAFGRRQPKTSRMLFFGPTPCALAKAWSSRLKTGTSPLVSSPYELLPLSG